MRYVVMFSSGCGSWGAARRVVDAHGAQNVTLLMADVLGEDEDNYRFAAEAAADLGAEFVQIAEGRTIWEVFRDERFLGNTRADPCSKILKRQFLRRHLEANFEPADTTVVLGIDWSEEHRFHRAKPFWTPWLVTAPLCEPPLVTKADLMDELRGRGIEPPRLTTLGFAHANCKGGCIKAGIGAFSHLLRTLPENYAWWEDNEEEIRRFLGRDVTILRDRTGGRVRPLTLRELRERIQSQPELALAGSDDWGGCGCFSGEVA